MIKTIFHLPLRTTETAKSPRGKQPSLELGALNFVAKEHAPQISLKLLKQSTKAQSTKFFSFFPTPQ